jgi:hypothetical protein
MPIDKDDVDDLVREGLGLLKRLGTRVVAAGAEEVADSIDSALEAGRKRVRAVRANARKIREGSYSQARKIDDDDEPYGFSK